MCLFTPICTISDGFGRYLERQKQLNIVVINGTNKQFLVAAEMQNCCNMSQTEVNAGGRGKEIIPSRDK